MEIALVGDRPDKIAIIESILGHPLIIQGILIIIVINVYKIKTKKKEIPFTKMVHFHLVNNNSYKEPNITFISSTALTNHSEEVKLSAFSEALMKRMSMTQENEIEIKYERASSPDLSFFIAPDVGDAITENTLDQLKQFILPQKR